jgi:hypothetical protein
VRRGGIKSALGGRPGPDHLLKGREIGSVIKVRKSHLSLAISFAQRFLRGLFIVGDVGGFLVDHYGGGQSGWAPPEEKGVPHH